MPVRLVAGAAVALLIALLALRARALSASGASAAVVVGTLAAGAGWSWAAVLIAYFASSSLLSRIGAATKDARMNAIVEKGGARDAAQVVANGLGFVVAAALSLRAEIVHGGGWLPLAALGAGTLAASASDTWGTELGALSRGRPRSILTWREVPTGSSGGVSAIGSLAALAGSAFVGAIVVVVGWPVQVAIAAAIGGIVGSTLDSLLGATLQARRRCERCMRDTERRIHDCGTPTRAAGGVTWLGNDAVNLVSSVAGGLVAMFLAS